MTGGLLLKQVQESTPTDFKAILQARNSDTTFVSVVEKVDAAEPHLIRQLTIMPVPMPAAFTPMRLTEQQAIRVWKSHLAEEAAKNEFSGTVLLAKDGKIVFEEAYGKANHEQNTPNLTDTKFCVGSLNKMFTAVAIMQLVQAGRIHLDAPIQRYLPDYPNKEAAAQVTIHQLLTHTSGMGDVFGPEFAAHQSELRTLQDYVRIYGSRPPAFKPGSRFAYSNYGYEILGVVIERVSGEDYYAYMHAHIFRPSGMASTDSLPENVSVANKAQGYEKDGRGHLTPNTSDLPPRGTAAGGGYSTVGDLFRFAKALKQHKLLDEKHTALLLSAKVNTFPGSQYAYGFYCTDYGGFPWSGHGGGAPGVNAEMQFNKRSGYDVAVLTNIDPPAAQEAAEFLIYRLPLHSATALLHK